MTNLTSVRATCVAIVAGFVAASALAQEPPSGEPATPPMHRAHNTGEAIRRDAKEVGGKVKKATKKAAEATRKGIDKAVDATERAVHKAGDAVKHAAVKTKAAISKPDSTSEKPDK